MNRKLKYMQLAFNEAFSQFGLTSPNPPVGAIIVKDDVVMSKGGTQKAGSDHAEITAIKNAKNAGINLDDAEMYITLEPCCHYGKTPPCTDAIIKSGIKKVYIPVLDPNPLVAGKGVKALTDAGVEVIILSELKSYAEQILYPFFTYINHGRAHIIHKAALTLDSKIATEQNDSKWISSPTARLLTHRLRSLVDGIIIGKGTFETDNPALNVRIEEFNGYNTSLSDKFNYFGTDNLFLQNLCVTDFNVNKKDPVRILLGLPDNINLDSPFFKDDNFYIFCNYNWQNNLFFEQSVYNELIEKGRIILVKYNNQIQFINEVIDFLTKEGLMFLLLEGGSSLGTNFLKAGLIDEILYFIAPKIIGNGLPVYGDIGTDYIKNCRNVKNITTTMVENDILYHGYLEY